MKRDLEFRKLWENLKESDAVEGCKPKDQNEVKEADDKSEEETSLDSLIARLEDLVSRLENATNKGEDKSDNSEDDKKKEVTDKEDEGSEKSESSRCLRRRVSKRCRG